MSIIVFKIVSNWLWVKKCWVWYIINQVLVIIILLFIPKIHILFLKTTIHLWTTIPKQVSKNNDNA
jgi:hypothetical protein